MQKALSMRLTRRTALAATAAVPLVAAAVPAWAKRADLWSAREAYLALAADEARLVDIRSRDEWLETGVAQGAWPISLHEANFAQRILAARSLAESRPLALICATGGRSASVLRALARGGYDGFVDISEGMLGSRAGKGWIAEGLPVVTLDVALAEMPAVLS